MVAGGINIDQLVLKKNGIHNQESASSTKMVGQRSFAANCREGWTRWPEMFLAEWQDTWWVIGSSKFTRWFSVYICQCLRFRMIVMVLERTCGSMLVCCLLCCTSGRPRIDVIVWWHQMLISKWLVHHKLTSRSVSLWVWCQGHRCTMYIVL